MNKATQPRTIFNKPISNYFVDRDKLLRLFTYEFSATSPSYMEDQSLFMVVNEGRGSIIINGEEFEIRPGSFLWLQSYHVFSFIPETGTTLKLSVLIYDYPLSSFLTFKRATPKDIDVTMKALPVINGSDDFGSQLDQLFHFFREIDNERDEGTALIKVSILGELAQYFINYSFLHRNENEQEHCIGWKSVLFINEYFHKPINAEITAEYFHTDPKKVNSQLRCITGHSFNYLLNRTRVDIAASALLYEGQPLSYISARSGFNSEASFYRIFKQYKGITPLEYRQQLLSDSDGVYRGMIMSSTLMKVLNHAYVNTNTSLNLKEASKELYIPEGEIRTTLNNAWNTNYSSLISLKKIRHGEALLVNTDLPVLDIAITLGYNCTKSFSRAFKKINGVTPGDYRKINKKH